MLLKSAHIAQISTISDWTKKVCTLENLALDTCTIKWMGARVEQLHREHLYHFTRECWELKGENPIALWVMRQYKSLQLICSEEWWLQTQIMG